MEWKRLETIKGANGYSPVKGIDYYTDKEIEDLNSFIKVRIKKESDITSQAIRNKLEELEGDARLDASAIKNISKYANTTIMSMGGGSATGSTTDVSNLLKIDRSNMPDGTITRSSGLIASIAYTGGRVLTVTRTGGYISSISDTVHTWTLTRNASNQIIAYAIT